MRRMLATLALIPSLACASIFEFDIAGNLANVPGTTVPLPNSAEISFMINTESAINNAFSFMTDPTTGKQCIGSFNFQGVTATNINATLGGTSIWNNGTGIFSIHGVDSLNTHCPSSFFGALDVSDSTHHLSASVDIFTDLLREQFLTADPVGSFVQHVTAVSDDGTTYSDAAGNRFTVSQQTQIVETPEPPMAWLFIPGLALLLLDKRVRRKLLNSAA